MPNRDSVPFRLTPVLLGSIVAALVGTILLAVSWYNDVHSSPPGPGQPPPASHSSLVVLSSAAGVLWVAVVIAAARDHIVRHIDATAARVLVQLAEYGDQREQDGIFRGMALEAHGDAPVPAVPNPPPSSPSPSPPPSSSLGGQVLPFPRSSSPENPAP